MGKHIQEVQHLFVKNVLTVRVKKNKSEEIAIEVHRHSVACAVALRCDAVGMLLGAFGKYRQVIHDTGRATFPDLLQRARFAQLGLVLSKRIGFPAAMDKGLELIGLGIVDGHRYPVYKLEAPGNHVVQGFQLFRERSVTIKSLKGILMIRHYSP